MTNTDILIDRATSSDIDFIANTIVEAEKSGTDISNTLSHQLHI